MRIEVDVDLEEFSTQVLQRELKSRNEAIPDLSRLSLREIELDDSRLVQLAHDLRTAFYARNASRFESLLVTLDPQNEPTPGLHQKEAIP